MGFSFAKRANFVEEIIIFSVFATLVLTSHAQLLPEEEVQVLRTISSKLQNTYWPYVNQSSCSGGFNYTEIADDIYSGVWCDCSFNRSTVCHVSRIQMKGLSLGGTLAKEFANLTYLRELDFSRNYLNGSIPAEFGKLPLVNFSLIGNRISGIIPVEIGDITTLEVLVLEDNLLEGNLPQNLGSLSNLKRLLLAANNFNGTIPVTFGKLRNLTDFRIDGSSMTGKIPDFIGNWTQLTRLNMQGTSMEGPIPASISVLKNLTDLRISDLKGPVMSFPNLQDMTSLQFLYLKNCSIVDTIPPYLKDFTNLDVLDLSFNSLTGEIGESIQPGKLRYLFLSDNLLTGAIPAWILSSRYNIDVSYNNFTQFPSVNCQFPNVNLVASHSSSNGNHPWCLQPDLPCPGDADHYSVFINCGGRSISFEGNEYEDNAVDSGITTFDSNERWAYSSSGTYMGTEGGKYITANDTPLSSPDAAIYQTARLSPSSLKYYGLCLRRGSYRVRLHFAEIMYSDNATFSSLGRRIFDVAIQGRVVLPDFNIAEEAKGVRKGIFRDFDVDVNGSTLEIHLYWTGKGTTAIPDRGVYGPLISAIAVTPNFDVSTGKGLSAGAIAGIVISSIAAKT